MKRTGQDTTLPEDLILLLQNRGFGGKRVYVPMKDAVSQPHDKLVKILEEVENCYETNGQRFYGARKELAQWDAKFSARAIAKSLSISMRSAQRLRPLAVALWKRFFRNTEIPIIKRLECMASAYQLDYMEINVFYRRERATLRKNVASSQAWFGTEFSKEVMEELQECLSASLGKRPWNAKQAGPQLLDFVEELDTKSTAARLEVDNEFDGESVDV